MTYRVEEDGAHRIVRVTLRGAYDRPLIEAMVAEARGASARNAWPILYDLREAKPGKMSPAEVFWLPRQHPSLQESGAASVRIAALHRPEHAPIAAFWENAFRNAGMQARSFTREDGAISWLGGAE